MAPPAGGENRAAVMNAALCAALPAPKSASLPLNYPWEQLKQHPGPWGGVPKATNPPKKPKTSKICSSAQRKVETGFVCTAGAITPPKYKWEQKTPKSI